MDQNSNSQPGITLPPPNPPAQTPAAASWLPPTVPVAGVPATGGVPAASPGAAAPVEARDSDLIENEWVVKAKEIVARTRQDPYLQTQELAKLRAEYMRKRYDRTMEASEG